ncbi:MAG TPA: hypothetical protein PLC42_00830 [Parachlamydiaceae bacterium]|nr:hypothetical protein [Parachlamydiaceae bacterium]
MRYSSDGKKDGSDGKEGSMDGGTDIGFLADLESILMQESCENVFAF